MIFLKEAHARSNTTLFSQICAYAYTMLCAGRRFMQWYRLSEKQRLLVWKFYGIFTALALAGCIPGIISAGIQLSDRDGFVALLFYFDDQRIFKDTFALNRLDGAELSNVILEFSIINVFDGLEFAFFSIAKILVARRLTIFVKLGRSQRATNVIEWIDRIVVALVVLLCSVTVISSLVICYYYAVAALNPILRSGQSVTVMAYNVSTTLDQGNSATVVMRIAMSSSILLSLITVAAATFFSSKGISATFTAQKMRESAEVRRTRSQIVAFCASATLAYSIDFLCAACPSLFLRLAFTNSFAATKL
jgi:hypothetical protein